MKILIGKVGHETNVFSSEIGTLKRWTQNEWVEGDALISRYKGKRDYLAGMMRAADIEGVTVIPTVAVMDAGPLITREAHDHVMSRLLAIVEQHKDELDGICIGLHGAGCAEGIESIETYTLKRIREIVGPEMPIAVTLDLHGNLQAELAQLAIGLFPVKLYPHIDAEEAGFLAMTSLAKHIRGEAKISTALVRMPLLVAPAVGCTMEMPMKEFTDYIKQYVVDHGLVDAALMHGFPFSDRAHVGASVIVVSDKDPLPAARELAQYVWDNRAKLVANTLSVGDALDKALELAKQNPDGFVAVNETSDNPGGGAPCDGTWLLAELIARDVPRSIVAYIHDPEIALKAYEAGVGAKISGMLGAKKDNLHGQPVEIRDAEVVAVSDSMAIGRAPQRLGREINYGKSARLRIGQVEVIVTENLAQQTLDDAALIMLGADLSDYSIVGIKSSNHFKAFYEPRAAAIVTADPPGIHTANFTQLPFKNLSRPLYPLDLDTVFENK